VVNITVYNIIKRVLKIFFKPPRISGLSLVNPQEPAIFVSNHLGFYGPLIIFLYLDLDLTPWVIHEVTDRKLCADYLRQDFVEPDLHLPDPFSRLAAAAIAPICVGLMRRLGAIPVYKNSRRIITTLEQSVGCLERGKSLIVFPEHSGRPLNGDINGFDSGFINIARICYGRNHSAVRFYPVAVNKRENSITIGEAVTIDSAAPWPAEKQRCLRQLTDTINQMYAGKTALNFYSSGAGHQHRRPGV
jgi:hypothetical protein